MESFRVNPVYHVPDGQENNIEIVRAENMFFSTPLNEVYSSKAYDALKEIETSCAADFKYLCSSSFEKQTAISERPLFLDDIMSQFLSPRKRRLTNNIRLHSGADYLNYLRSFYAYNDARIFHPLAAVFFRSNNAKQSDSVVPPIAAPLKATDKIARSTKLRGTGSKYIGNSAPVHLMDRRPKTAQNSGNKLEVLGRRVLSQESSEESTEIPTPEDVSDFDYHAPCYHAQAENESQSKGYVFFSLIFKPLQSLPSIGKVLGSSASFFDDDRIRFDDDQPFDDDYFSFDDDYYSYYGSDDSYYYSDNYYSDSYYYYGSDDTAVDGPTKFDPDYSGLVDRMLGQMIAERSASEQTTSDKKTKELKHVGQPPKDRYKLQRSFSPSPDGHMLQQSSQQDRIEHDRESEHDHHHHHHEYMEDRSFAGNLGFGAEGDMCMYKNVVKGNVSPPCLQSIANLYGLRQQYWEDYQNQQFHHNCGGVFVFFAGLTLLYLCAKRFFGHKRRTQIRSLLTTLHTNPELKAAVEAETGTSVPLPLPMNPCCSQPTSSSTRNQQNTSACSFAKRCAVGLAFFSFILLTSFLISVSSLEITIGIVQSMDAHSADTDDQQPTSPLLALLILFGVCSLELLALGLMIRGCKNFMTTRRQDRNEPLPSAPVFEAQHPGYFVLPSIFRTGSAAPMGYAVLPGGDDENTTELTNVTSRNVQVGQLSRFPRQPISATPVNSVHLV